MASKRKRSDDLRPSDSVYRPEPGTKSFTSGVAVRDGLAVGSRQALVSFHQQIVTPHSQLPLDITHPTILILQHYLDTSPTADEIFKAWKLAEESKNEKLAETAALLLAQVIRILTPLRFFHTQVTSIVTKLVAPTEPYADLLGRLLQSGRREHILAGLSVAAAAVNVDTPDPSNLHGGARGRLALKVWASLVEGGSAKLFPKMMSMRRRTKEGAVEYGDKDPMDRPDVRHMLINLILPLLPTTQFHSHAKHMLSNMYSGLAIDPPTTVYRVLNAMWESISAPPPGTARRIALVLLDESAIDNISKLLDRNATEPTTNVAVGEMALGFLQGVTSTPGTGICFPDEGWYPREEDEVDPKKKRGLHNRILSNVVKRLGARVVDDEGRVGAWVLKMFQACPELVAGYWAHSALSLEPRLDARWIATMAYIGRVISLPLPDRSKFNQPAPRGADAVMPPRATPPAVLTIIESVLPSPLTKTHLSKGLQHNDALVQHVTSLALARALQKLAAVQALFATIAAEVDDDTDGLWATRARELEAECRRRVPEVPVIIAFAQKAATLARPKDEDDDVEPSLVARGAMLTEAALRLFGLYHKTLPSLAGEARFDVGKLLVSASSANAERRARREAREGSVVSDSGSVGSVGTLGTVGMGGGFGHARGDVEGFEALSQLHVLRLLSEVRDWSWTKKAAGSQFTYLYHILQLHLSTRNVVTHSMTTTLLHKLLQPSLLFEHDPLELAIWLDALPRVSDTAYGPMFVAQQIHLLSFVDECVRRALKTPHRYIEDAAAVVSGLSPRDVASPFLLTVVEQLHAKLMGMHIATEAAAVVLNYLRRVLVGLLGKQATGEFVRAITKRVSDSIEGAKAAGQPRHGLAEIVELINSDIDVVFLDAEPVAADPETPTLRDAADWQGSFTSACLDGRFGFCPASPEENARRAQFLVHFVAARPEPAILNLIAELLRAPSDRSSARLKSAVFNDPAVRSLFLTSAGDKVRAELSAIAATLNTGVPIDRALAEHYAAAAVDSLKKAPEIALPWVRFMAPSQVEAALKAALKSKKDNVAPVLSALVAVAKPEALHKHLSALLSRGVYSAISARLLSIVSESLSRRLEIEITPKIIKELVAGGDDAYALLALLVSLSPEAAKVFAAEVDGHAEWLDDARILPAAAEAKVPSAAAAAVKALANPALSEEIHSAAIALLPLAPEQVNATIGALPTATFSLPLARASAAMALHASKDPTAALSPSVSKLLDNGLHWAASTLASPTLAGDEIATLEQLASTLTLTATLHVEPDIARAEATIEAAVARDACAAALDFAAALAPRTMLKASYIRNVLTSLIAPRLISPLSLPSADPAARTAYAKLAHAIFTANTYVSAQPNFIEPLLPFYRGTMAQADQLVLAMFAAFENQRHLSVTSVLKHWGNASGRALDALSALDPAKVFATCAAFPLRRTLATSLAPATDEVYDPAFVLPLLSAVLMEELAPLDWVEVLRTNALGLAVCALSSRDAGMRTLAGWLLKTTLEKVHNIGFHEKLQMVHTLELVAHAIDAPAKPADAADGEGAGADASALKLNQPRLPSLITLFIAHALRSIAHPGHFLFPLASRFLLQRPVLDAADVPMLYGMLYASGDNGRRERGWIVRFLKDGVRSEADYRLLARRNTLSLLATLFASSTDAVFRRNLLSAMAAMAAIPSGARAILRAHVPWLASQWAAAATRPNTDAIRDAILDMLDLAVARGAEPRASAEVARVLVLAGKDATPARLEVLSRAALRLAESSSNTDAIPGLVARLTALGDEEVDVATEYLFRASLYLPAGAAQPAVKALSARVARLGGPVGEWARETARS